MSRTSYRPTWEKRFHEHREGFIRLSRWDPFEGWEQDTAPESRAEDSLVFALEVLYGRGELDLARQFLEHAVAKVQRALVEAKVQAPRCQDSFPENRGSLLRTRAYAEVLLGRALEEATLLVASADYEAACAGFPKGKWDDYQEARNLSALRLALLGGGVEATQRLLQRRQVFRFHAEEHGLLRALGESLVAGVPVRDEVFRSRFEAFFDRVRDPDYYPQNFSVVPILRLELGLLRDKYLSSPDGAIDWRRVIDAIAA